MFSVTELHLDDVKAIVNEPINAHLSAWRENDYALAKSVMSQARMSLTGLVDGVPVISVFIFHIWRGRGYLVVLLSEKIKQFPLQVYRGIKAFIPTLPFNRLEYDSPCELALGHKRARFLGFRVMCGRAEKFLPNGKDATVYEWVRS